MVAALYRYPNHWIHVVIRYTNGMGLVIKGAVVDGYGEVNSLLLSKVLIQIPSYFLFQTNGLCAVIGTLEATRDEG